MNIATPPPQRSGRYDAGVMKYKLDSGHLSGPRGDAEVAEQVGG